MSFLKKPSISVLNSVAASYGDVTVGSGNVEITGNRPFRYSDVTLFTIEKSLVETINTLRVYITAIAADTYYEFTIVQDVDGDLRRVPISVYSPDPALSLSAFDDAVGQQVQGYVTDGYLKLAVTELNGTGGRYGVQLDGIADYPLFNIDGAVTNMTVDSLLGNADTASNDGTVFTANITALAGTTTVTVTSNGHNVLEGQSVRITGFGGTLNGVSGSSELVFRVTTVAANTFVLDGAVGASLTLSSTSVTIEPQNDRGDGAELTSVDDDIVSTNTYTKLTVREDRNNKGEFTSPSRDELVWYINEGDADYATFLARLVEIKNGYAPSTTNFDPALAAV